MYNEEAGAERCVRAVTAQLASMPEQSMLIAVNDGSRDRTGEILDLLAREYAEMRAVHHNGNRGYGAALRTGIEYAIAERYEYCVFMDSDLTNNPADLPRFAAEMNRGVDVIKASRFIAGGGMSGVPFRRAIVSRAGNFVARSLFRLGIHDCTNGFRAVKTDILARMNLQERGFAVIVEELYQCAMLARTFSEVPVVLTNRAVGQRSTSFAYRPAVFRTYFRYAWNAFWRGNQVDGQFRKI
jgi:dolichol-phosphate mannosyltransferase